MKLIADRLCKTFNGQNVLRDVSFSVTSGETLAIVGRSGCGKTTLLRMLAGFLPPDDGCIWLDERKALFPDKDRLMVFQSFDQLFPWFSLRKNIQYALKKTRPELKRDAARELALRCLAEMGLEDAADKYPYQLSGGMKQRGAMARAMALAPKALLLDEPFSSLDEYSRQSARESLQTLTKATDAAVVLVTHDLDEAVEMATDIALMRADKQGIYALMKNQGEGIADKLRTFIRD